MKKYLGNFIKLAVSLGIGIGLIWIFVGQMSASDKQHVVDDIKRANYFWVLMGPFVGLISNYFRTQRWRLLLKPLGYQPRFLNTFMSVLIMYFFNLFFPRLGEVSRCGVLARYEHVPVEKGVGTMVLERLTDVVCLGIVWIMLLVFEHDKFTSLFNTDWNTKFADIIAKYNISPTVKYGVLGAVLLIIIIFLAAQLRRKGFKNITASIWERVKGLWLGLISIKDISNPFEFLFHSIMIWVCYFLMIYLSFRMFPETASLGIGAGALCLFFGGIAYSLTPGGLGLYPIFIQLILTLYGITSSAAISMGLVAWSAQTAFVLLAGVVSLILLAILNREPALEEVTVKS